jgi:hypothetical protein
LIYLFYQEVIILVEVKYKSSKKKGIKTIHISFIKWRVKNIISVRLKRGDYGVIVFNATFNNISVISWQSVLLVEET